MLTVSSKVIYSILALYELAICPKGKCLQIKEIAHAQNIPVSFLEQILNILKKAGFIHSIRGAQGGYKLAKDPDQFTILDIIQSVEGDLALVNTSIGLQLLSEYFNEIESQLIKSLNVSLKDLINESRNKNKQDMFYI